MQAQSSKQSTAKPPCATIEVTKEHGSGDPAVVEAAFHKAAVKQKQEVAAEANNMDAIPKATQAWRCQATELEA